MKINNINLKIITDSRGEDTLEVEMESSGVKISASVPSGKSIGKNEAYVLSPPKAIVKIPWILSQVKNHDFATLEQFDNLLITLDGTDNKQSLRPVGLKQNLGGNLILVLSIAFTKLLAELGNLEIYELISRISGLPVGGSIKLPFCFFNLIEGGVHDDLPNGLPFQEYLVIPRTDSTRESLEQVMAMIKILEEDIENKYKKIKHGDEGGDEIPSNDPLEGLQILQDVIRETNTQAFLSLDVAASTFYQNGNYQVGGKVMSTDQLLSYYNLLTTNYQLLSIEDPFAENDWEGFSQIKQQLGNDIWIVGDDLLTTNITRMKTAHDKNAVNAMIIKPNQIGTVSETIQAANLAKSYGWKIIVSHRSGETMDSFIADLAVGLGADGLKAGCPLQKERLVKYQRLIEIEERI